MAAAVGPDGLVVAGDIRGRRIDLLRQTLTRAGCRAGVRRADRPQQAAAVRAGVRLRLRGCAVLGARHDSPRAGDPVAACVRRSVLRSPRRSSACWGMQRRRSGPVDGSCTPPAPASRKRTRTWSPLSCARSPRFTRHGRARVAAPAADTDGSPDQRCRPSPLLALAARPRGVLRRRDGPAVASARFAWRHPPTCSTFYVCMLFRTRVWGAGKLLVLAAALLGTFVIFAAAAMRVALRAREVSVPNLAGRTVQDATAILADHGLTLRVDEVQRVDPKVPAGRITQQDPTARSRGPPAARGQGVAQPRAAGGRGPRVDGPDGTHGADASAAGRARARLDRRDPLERVSAGRDRGAESPARHTGHRRWRCS